MDIGLFQQTDLQSNKIVMMIRILDPHQETCKIRVVFSLRKEMLIDIETSIRNYSQEQMLIGRLS